MNLQHTKIRNRLEPERVDKLVYIYMNSRVLREINGGAEHLNEGDIEAELLVLEDEEMEKAYLMQEFLGEAAEEPLPATKLFAAE